MKYTPKDTKECSKKHGTKETWLRSDGAKNTKKCVTILQTLINAENEMLRQQAYATRQIENQIVTNAVTALKRNGYVFVADRQGRYSQLSTWNMRGEPIDLDEPLPEQKPGIIGMYSEEIEVNGKFDADTLKAVKAREARMGWKQDGLVGAGHFGSFTKFLETGKPLSKNSSDEESDTTFVSTYHPTPVQVSPRNMV